MVQIES